MSFTQDASHMLDALQRTPGWDIARGDLDDATVAAVLESKPTCTPSTP